MSESKVTYHADLTSTLEDLIDYILMMPIAEEGIEIPTREEAEQIAATLIFQRVYFSPWEGQDALVKRLVELRLPSKSDRGAA